MSADRPSELTQFTVRIQVEDAEDLELAKLAASESGIELEEEPRVDVIEPVTFVLAVGGLIALGGFVLGPSAVLRRELPAQYQPEDHQAVNKTDQREAKMNPGEIARLLIAVGRQGVLRDSLRWRLRGCRRRGSRRCLLHER